MVKNTSQAFDQASLHLNSPRHQLLCSAPPSQLLSAHSFLSPPGLTYLVSVPPLLSSLPPPLSSIPLLTHLFSPLSFFLLLISTLHFIHLLSSLFPPLFYSSFLSHQVSSRPSIPSSPLLLLSCHPSLLHLLLPSPPLTPLSSLSLHLCYTVPTHKVMHPDMPAD